MEATVCHAPSSAGIKREPLATAGVLAVGLGTLLAVNGAQTDARRVSSGTKSYELHPTTLKDRPDLPSPYRAKDGLEVLTARTEQRDYVLVPVTITSGVTVNPWEAPLEIDAADFPTLARTGRHSEAELDLVRSITGVPVAEISEFGRPGRLSRSGFMAEDEDILSVLKGDNRLVTRLGLTHPELARPLLHVCHMIRQLYQETGRGHTNEVLYGNQWLSVEVEFSRGGQKSLFDDRLDGAWKIKIRRDLNDQERTFLNRAYAHVEPPERATLVERLTEMMTGEMQPFYVYRYGFYEGHTAWRTDPIAIAFLFGLKPIEKIEAAFPGQLHRVLTQHFTGKSP